MRKMFVIGLDNTLLTLFYKTCILSVLNFCLTAWGGNARASDKTKIDRLLRQTNKMLQNMEQDTVAELFDTLANVKINKIMRDETNALNDQIQFSQRSGRLIHVKARTTRHHQSFLPYAVRNYKVKFL